jgi:hypothetical protein
MAYIINFKKMESTQSKIYEIENDEQLLPYGRGKST